MTGDSNVLSKKLPTLDLKKTSDVELQQNVPPVARGGRRERVLNGKENLAPGQQVSRGAQTRSMEQPNRALAAKSWRAL